MNFDYFSKPPAASLQSALELLYDLEAVNEDMELTELGRKASSADGCHEPDLITTLLRWHSIR